MRLCALILAGFPFAAWAQGPIETRNHQAASLVFLRLNPRGALLAPGERLFGLNLSIANSLRLDGDVREDQETQRLGMRYAWGVPKGEWAVELPFLARNGGILDPIIDGYHGFFGIHNFRGGIEYGNSEESLGSSGRFSRAAGLGDLSGTYSRALGPQAFVTLGLKLPTGNAGGLLGSGGVDLAASLYNRWKIGRHFDLYGQVGLVFQGPVSRLNRRREFVDQESLALTYRQNSRDSWAFQWQSEPSAIKTGQKFVDGPHRQLALGYTRRLAGNDTLQVYFNEDGDFLNYRAPELVNVAPDFTIGVNWTKRF